jgi:hypothetical protein
MDNINRIKDLIGKVETRNYTISEQSLAGDVWDLGAGVLGGLYDATKAAVSDGVPWLVDKTTNKKILQSTPFQGKLDTVCSSAAKLFKSSIVGNVESKTDVYNALIILNNLLLGAQQSKIVDNKGLDFKIWEVFETFTGALYYELKGQTFSYSTLWADFIKEDDIDDVADYVSSYIKDNVSYNATIGPLGEEIKEFMIEFFKSGKSFTAFWNNDRLDGDWNVGGIQPLIDKIDMSDYQDSNRLQSEFETRLSTDLPCYESAKLVFVSTNNSDKINAAVKVENKWTTIIYYDRNGKLTANVYFGGVDRDPVAVTTDLDCGNGAVSGQNIDVVGLNEAFIMEQQPASPKKYVNYGSLRIGFDSETFEELRALHTGNTKPTPADVDQQNTEEPTTTQTTTIKPESGNEEKPVVTPEATTNVERLIQLLLSKGVNEVFAKDIKYRASMGSVSVGALLGKTVTEEEYTKDEENLYAEKFIESINKGITTFSKNETNHEKEAKEEERIIDTTTRISNPTPLELKKIEEVGDDAVAKTKNELSFDKNRIKSVRVTANESTVVYIAKEDITDLVSSIEGQLEQVFGGDWKLDSARNKFMSSNKVFIFSKKEQ